MRKKLIWHYQGKVYIKPCKEAKESIGNLLSILESKEAEKIDLIIWKLPLTK